MLGDAAEVPGLAHALSASFIGLELVAVVDPDGDTLAAEALDRLGMLAERLDEAGPVMRRAVRGTVRRTARKGQGDGGTPRKPGP